MNLPLISRRYLDEVMEPTWPPAASRTFGPFRLREAQGGGKRVGASTAEADWREADLFALEAECPQTLFAIREGDEALDAALAARGYDMVDPVLIYRKPLVDIAPEPSAMPHWPPLALARDLWAENDIGAGRIVVMERVKGPKAVLMARRGERIGGLAFVACAKDQAMIHALLTAPQCRRQGIGRQLMQAAAAWAATEGAQALTLAVTAQNAAARALYAQENMEIIGRYHYRMRR